ncbi:histidine phosphatase family protein [Glycomyces sp. TRM65418]|uniref:histidine phosphatase family protein n=1 Tax=Glycomyces sp. TRM65418 TaxID=2867006 RepID=UPI001CE5C473|nr:histidine phosphatase family protein [Glycomyces sp. TRM65418]MCC3762710.1 histidine phosphatase family protein [Glycomyces sp. TRM65418]QZD56745.1 histidine phosphatase family protein [Glycomyces sp. TRM65418]
MSGSTTVVHLLRHGEVHNPAGILYGRIPGFGLSELGREMALAAAERLAGRDVVHVGASPLQRAQETAEPIAASHRMDITTYDGLIEAGNSFEGLRVGVGDGALRRPKYWWRLRDPFRPSWGEAYLDIARRMMDVIEKARVAAEGAEAVLVSHQLPIWTVRRFAERKRLWHDPRRRQCALASITSFVYEGPSLDRVEYSEPAAHLILQSESAQKAKGA